MVTLYGLILVYTGKIIHDISLTLCSTHAPNNDPCLTMELYTRTAEQDLQLGISQVVSWQLFSSCGCCHVFVCHTASIGVEWARKTEFS